MQRCVSVEGTCIVIACTQYHQEHGLDSERLLDSSSYKETYRRDMIRWGEERRDSDPSYFCRLAESEADKPVWLVCDARRPSDMQYFTTHYTCMTVRIPHPCFGEMTRMCVIVHR